MEASISTTRRVRKKRRSTGSARPAPKGRKMTLGAGLAGIVIVALAVVYGLVGPEPAGAVVPGFASSR
jgi:hypothetical protein